MKQLYKDFLGWVVTTNGDPWRLETEEDVDDFVRGRGYRFVGEQLPDNEDEIRDILFKLDIKTDAPGVLAGETWTLDMVAFEDGETAYMGIERHSYLFHPHNQWDE